MNKNVKAKIPEDAVPCDKCGCRTFYAYINSADTVCINDYVSTWQQQR
jgi:hypothetical protein